MADKQAIIIGAGPAGLTAAYKLLKETDLPIGEIATRCGFPVQTHLNAIFRRTYGTTLRAYRHSGKST